LPTGDRVWKVQITSVGALGVIPLFDKLYIPEGSFLHIYIPKREEILGAFTHDNTLEPRAFCAGLIHGETCVVEYFEPASQKGNGMVSINQVGHAYRWVAPLKSTTDTTASGSCQVNVACSEAANWTNQVRGVARILVVVDNAQGYCTGSLVNNTQQNCTPYFLTAQHCSQGATANEYSQWIFYFNYQAGTCAGTTGPENKTVNGCTKVADSDDNGGDTGSDFLLLQLSSIPPNSYNVYYNGWDKSNTTSASGVCIHHPDGDIKKVSTYTQSIGSTSWGGTAPGTHWDVQWDATMNGHGVTEAGSSGAPLFNSAGLIIGTLTGGSSLCSSPNLPDLFGKVSYDWIENGLTSNLQLKPWLDPSNTGVSSLAGTNAPCVNTSINYNSANTIAVKIIPNPSTGRFVFEFATDEEKNVRVIDALGRIILEEKMNGRNVSINLLNQSRGVYLLQVETKTGRLVQKIVVE
jgi:hypothetical protein